MLSRNVVIELVVLDSQDCPKSIKIDMLFYSLLQFDVTLNITSTFVINF